MAFLASFLSSTHDVIQVLLFDEQDCFYVGFLLKAARISIVVFRPKKLRFCVSIILARKLLFLFHV